MKSVVVILDLTNDCNLRCEYCYLSGGEKQEYMSTETALTAVDKIFNRYKCRINLLFHGGEPLLCFNIIKQIIDEIGKKYYAEYIRYYIQTNGTCLSNEIIDFLMENKVNVGISIDGFDDNSNAARKDPNGNCTTAQVIERMKNALERGLDLSILSIINKYNYKTYDQDVLRFCEIGVTSFTLNPFIPAGRGRQANLGVSAEDMFELYKKMVNVIIESKNSENHIFEKNIYYMLRKLKTGHSGYMCMNAPCRAGLAQYTVAPTGLVYPCADFCGVNGFELGNVNEDFFTQMVNNKQWKKISNYKLSAFDECKDCIIFHKCTAGCVVRAYFNNGDVNSIDPICKLNKLLIPYMNQEKVLNQLKFLLDGITAN